MTKSDDYKKEFNAGNFAQALKLALTEAIELKITTWVMPAEDENGLVENARPGERMKTRINLIDGDIDNEIGSLFLSTGPYAELREFHMGQVRQGREIIQRNLENLEQIFNTLASALSGKFEEPEEPETLDVDLLSAEEGDRTLSGEASATALPGAEDWSAPPYEDIAYNDTPPLDVGIEPDYGNVVPTFDATPELSTLPEIEPDLPEDLVLSDDIPDVFTEPILSGDITEAQPELAAEPPLFDGIPAEGTPLAGLPTEGIATDDIPTLPDLTPASEDLAERISESAPDSFPVATEATAELTPVEQLLGMQPTSEPDDAFVPDAGMEAIASEPTSVEQLLGMQPGVVTPEAPSPAQPIPDEDAAAAGLTSVEQLLGMMPAIEVDEPGAALESDEVTLEPTSVEQLLGMQPGVVTPAASPPAQPIPDEEAMAAGLTSVEQLLGMVPSAEPLDAMTLDADLPEVVVESTTVEALLGMQINPAGEVPETADLPPDNAGLQSDGLPMDLWSDDPAEAIANAASPTPIADALPAEAEGLDVDIDALFAESEEILPDPPEGDGGIELDIDQLLDDLSSTTEGEAGEPALNLLDDVNPFIELSLDDNSEK